MQNLTHQNSGFPQKQKSFLFEQFIFLKKEFKIIVAVCWPRIRSCDIPERRGQRFSDFVESNHKTDDITG